MIFICYPKCTTCKKAQDYLNARGVSYELRDIKEDNPGYDELKEWMAITGLCGRQQLSGVIIASANRKT